jgi:hypothetical protein
LPFSSFRSNPASHPQMPVRKSSIAVLSSDFFANSIPPLVAEATGDGI